MILSHDVRRISAPEGVCERPSLVASILYSTVWDGDEDLSVSRWAAAWGCFVRRVSGVSRVEAVNEVHLYCLARQAANEKSPNAIVRVLHS